MIRLPGLPPPILALLALAILTDLATGQDDKLARDFETLAAIFEPPGVPGIQGKQWKVADVGPANWKGTSEGWVLEETPQAIVLDDVWFGGRRSDNDKLPQPADELKKLGVAAAPYLIAHLGDGY